MGLSEVVFANATQLGSEETGIQTHSSGFSSDVSFSPRRAVSPGVDLYTSPSQMRYDSEKDL